jgi:hypothetical protein
MITNPRQPQLPSCDQKWGERIGMMDVVWRWVSELKHVRS